MQIGANTGGNLGAKKEFTPLTEGRYSVVLQKLEEKPTKKGNGAYLDATFEVAEGDNKGRLIFERFMIDHPSAKVVEIGKDRINKFLKAVGLPNGLADLEGDTNRVAEFANKLVIANVKIEEGTEYTDANGNVKLGKDRNKITSFSVR